MSQLLQSFRSDERGFLVSAELIIVSTILVIGLMTGLASIQNAIVCELNDVAGAISALNQGYAYPGTWTFKGGGWCRAMTSGSAFIDINQCGGGFIGSDCGFGGASIGVGQAVSVAAPASVPMIAPAPQATVVTPAAPIPVECPVVPGTPLPALGPAMLPNCPPGSTLPCPPGTVLESPVRPGIPAVPAPPHLQPLPAPSAPSGAPTPIRPAAPQPMERFAPPAPAPAK